MFYPTLIDPSYPKKNTHLILKGSYDILIDLTDLKRFYLVLMDSSYSNKHIYPTLVTTRI
jgi:hypothetical protein